MKNGGRGQQRTALKMAATPSIFHVSSPSGNDQNRVLMIIPFEESTLVRCLGGCVLKSVVLQSDLKSLWLIYLASWKIFG